MSTSASADPAYGLYCPVPPVDPLGGKVLNERSFRWFRALGLARGQWLAETEAACPMDLLAMACPEGVPERMRVVADLWLWEYAFDDHFFDAGEFDGDPTSAATLLMPHAYLLECPRYATPAPGSWEAAMLDVRTRMAACGPGTQLDRWSAIRRDLLLALIFEAAARQRGEYLSLRDTIRLRMDTTGALSYLNMIGFLHGYELSAAELAWPETVAATHACSAVLSLDNDLFSYDREKVVEPSVLMNAVETVAVHARLPATLAAQRVVELRNRIMRLLVRLTETLSRSGSAELAHYAKNMTQWVRANLDWSLATHRYVSYRPDADATFAVHLHLTETAAPSPAADTSTSIWWWDLID
nr:hypothetical protein [Kibdelosporangium sp. MJ126-NF4]CEL12793.1 Pentalenene synthase (PS) (Sesquiterpene synthase) (Sesquiterpene cyclase) [Kibdelosporangium sp. MJ126-NF4]CTQ98479.1 Pentalenene synthase (EC 4.2.3.7) (PS) (Sesquiterpene synthase) (Sesquiterpene cyclase) [Kibdelosporangium sp. MJ126-NF4]